MVHTQKIFLKKKSVHSSTPTTLLYIHAGVIAKKNQWINEMAQTGAKKERKPEISRGMRNTVWKEAHQTFGSHIM